METGVSSEEMGCKSSDRLILLFGGLEIVDSVIVVGWTGSTASVVALLVVFSIGWKPVAIWIVGDLRLPVLMCSLFGLAIVRKWWVIPCF